ncbi:MAG: R3H domain-containing nucleic acid-binding protein [bacterium]|nr:R3H domain-containing nucleic acid-binding protein [bacterium]
MISREQRETIKEIIRNFFDKATIEVEIKEETVDEDTFRINLETESPQLLIGEGGQTLSEIQHLLRLICRKKIGPGFYLDIDVSNYKKKKAVYLEELAKTAADEVALTKKDRELLPMSSQDRRIIHLVLSQRADVIAESKGEDPDRRVIIRPA